MHRRSLHGKKKKAFRKFLFYVEPFLNVKWKGGPVIVALEEPSLAHWGSRNAGAMARHPRCCKSHRVRQKMLREVFASKFDVRACRDLVCLMESCAIRGYPLRTPRTGVPQRGIHRWDRKSPLHEFCLSCGGSDTGTRQGQGARCEMGSPKPVTNLYANGDGRTTGRSSGARKVGRRMRMHLMPCRSPRSQPVGTAFPRSFLRCGLFLRDFFDLSFFKACFILHGKPQGLRER